LAERAAIAWRDASPRSGAAWFSCGLASFALNKRAEAARCFGMAVDTGGDPLSALLASDPIASSADEKWMDGSGLPAVATIAAPPFPADNVFYIACDPSYFVKYGVAWLQSAHANCVGARIHLHLMDAEPADLRRISAFAASMSRLTVAITAEKVGVREAPARHRAACYTGMRLIRLSQFLNTSHSTYWMFDVDALFNRDPRNAVKELPEFDLAAATQPTAIEPWYRIVANMLIVRPTSSGCRMLEISANFIVRTFRENKIAWGQDQLALFAAWEAMSRRGAPVKLQGLSMEVADSGDQENTCVWLQSGRRKWINAHHAQSEYSASDVAQSRYVSAFRRFNHGFD
jgi:hypothetical protein